MLCKILRLIIKNRNVRLFEKIMFYASSKQNSLHFQANIKAYNDKSNKFEDNKYNKKQNEHNTITSDIKVINTNNKVIHRNIKFKEKVHRAYAQFKIKKFKSDLSGIGVIKLFLLKLTDVKLTHDEFKTGKIFTISTLDLSKLR